MKMKFLVICILITTVNGRNSRNVEFNELPEEKLLDAVCRSFRKMSTPFYPCDAQTCDWKNKSLTLTDFKIHNESTLSSPKLICKEDSMANFFWESSNDFAYFFEIENVKEDSNFFSNVTTCSHYTMEDLISDTNYNISVWAVSYSQKLITHTNEMKFNTSNKYKIPSPVTDIFLKNVTCTDNSCEAIVGWSPNEDYSCQYDLVWIKEGYINEDRINVISGLHQAELRDLKFETEYTVQIMARTEGSLQESKKKSLKFLTPSCLKIFRNLDKCRPEVPKHLIINESIVDSSAETLIYNVHLSWEKPDLLPSYYIAHFSNLVDYTTGENKLNITGNETKAIFKNVRLDELYHVSLMACSPAGCSPRIADERHRIEALTIDASHHKWRVLTLILVPLIAVMVGTLLINYYRRKQKRREERERYFAGLDEEKLPESAETVEINLIKQDISDQWELESNKLYFQSIIGEGAFGVVRMAYLEIQNNSKIPVAVKMLKESPSSDEIRQFTQEINIMKSVRQHPYIVSLIGCITEGRVEGPLLVVEYCSRGDLQTYLRTAWDKFCSMHQEVLNSDETSNNQGNYFANKTYDFHDVNSEDEFIIQPKHLLSIARQVSLGMEHLAKTRVVHRDLAARNVLVCENHTVKVSDFGLSRDIYRDNVYCKSSGGKLPIRWMAIESLTHQRYTTHSDVWSFGILLWEIVTLGGTPYVGIHASDLLEFLKSGSRLARPSNCSPELYNIMQSCWKTSPKNRPTFTELCKSIEDLLENVSYYLQLGNVDVPLNCDTTKLSSIKSNQSVPSSEHYLKTINTAK